MVVKRTKVEWIELVEKIRREGAIPLSQAAKTVPARNRAGHASSNTLRRWILHGKDGVYLEGCTMHGNVWWTSIAAIQRFLTAVSQKRLERILTTKRATEDEPLKEKILSKLTMLRKL